MLPNNIINYNSETCKITQLSQFGNLEKIINYLKLEISIL